MGNFKAFSNWIQQYWLANTSTVVGAAIIVFLLVTWYALFVLLRDKQVVSSSTFIPERKSKKENE